MFGGGFYFRLVVMFVCCLFFVCCNRLFVYVLLLIDVSFIVWLVGLSPERSEGVGWERRRRGGWLVVVGVG